RRLGGEVTGGGAVQGVIRRRVEAELLCDGLRVQLQRGTRQRARTIGRDSQALIQVLQALNIAQQRLGVSQQRVGQQDRLRSLGVRLTRHDRLRVSLRLGSQRVDQ